VNELRVEYHMPASVDDGPRVHLSMAIGPPEPAAPAPVPTLADLAAPLGKDRREREVIKKRFRTLYGKLTALPADQRRAFLQYINQTITQ
jgi:hypothetical protein